ncbi:acetyl-CoA carboxylase biotin carboxyl carrier protein subunit [Flavobacterium psychrotrophum]|uniref:acetyl-CoA carboxylase biotin carboxyl carrier protein subunit n=1 Tax=Flavobacterium psychrotrophum TaxID=2294119 RepID=UPI000E30E560|nr:acetyl-CoA carboxylase biotin carboxyl carrier protein subunit [Flavobacterium psychrotrophum]
MNDTFTLSINGNTEIDITEAQLAAFDAISTAEGSYHVLKDNLPYRAEVVSKSFLKKTYTVAINNNTYEVHIGNALDRLIKNMGFEIGTAKQVNDIKAPIPGLILEIAVTEGQEVQENDTLLILEAMKMENTFHSPRAGVIKSIAVTKGQAVDKGQLLIEFE